MNNDINERSEFMSHERSELYKNTYSKTIKNINVKNNIPFTKNNNTHHIYNSSWDDIPNKISLKNCIRLLMEKIGALTRATLGGISDEAVESDSFNHALEGLPSLLAGLVSAMLADEVNRFENAENAELPAAKRPRSSA